MARLQPHVLRQGAVLVDLGLGQRLALVGVAGRGIGHGGIQPPGIEGVAQVVMGMDVLLRARPAVVAKQVQDAVQHPHQRGAESQALNLVEVQTEDAEQGRHVRRLPLPGHVSLGEADIASRQHAVHEGVVADDQPPAGARLRADQVQLAAGGQNEGECADSPVPRQQAKGAAKGRRGAAQLWGPAKRPRGPGELGQG